MDKSLSEKEIDRLFIEGDRDLHRGNYKNAVDVFEELLEILEPSHKLYFNIQRNLVKAYQHNEQLDKAIVLCELLIGSDDSTASIWGNSFMSQLNPQFISAVEPETESKTETRRNKPITKIKQKTLSQFKDYCQTNLLLLGVAY